MRRARADVPEMVVESAHFHQCRPPQAFPEFEHELRLIVPGTGLPAENVAAVQGVKIDGIEPALIEGIGGRRRDFVEKRRFGIGHKKPKAFLEVLDLRVPGVGRGPCPQCTALATREPAGMPSLDSSVRDQLVVDLHGDAVAHEEARDGGHLLRGLDSGNARGPGRKIGGQRERGVLGQPLVGNRRNPRAGLVDEERIGVKPGLDAGGVQLIDGCLQAGAALGIDLRVGAAVAETKRVAAVKLDLLEPDRLGRGDPIAGCFFRNAVEVEEIGISVARRISAEGPPSGEWGRSGAADTTSCMTALSSPAGQAISAALAPRKPKRG